MAPSFNTNFFNDSLLSSDTVEWPKSEMKYDDEPQSESSLYSDLTRSSESPLVENVQSKVGKNLLISKY